MKLAAQPPGAGAIEGHASWENEGGAISSAAHLRHDAGAGLHPGSATPSSVLQEGDGADEVASLNARGARVWFIPPFVIPSVIAALVVVYAVYRT